MVQPRGSEYAQAAEVAGATFVVPTAFKVERFSDSKVAFLRHTKSELALFVAASGRH